MTARYKVAVAGCGPAGLATALLLHRRGHAVEIFERFPEPRAVGSGLMLQPTGMAVLRELGLANAAASVSAAIHRLTGRSATSGRKVLDVRYAWLGTETVHAFGIHRSALFDTLFGAVADAGLTIHPGRAVSGTSLDHVGRRLIFEDGGYSSPFDLVVDAMGMRSPVAQCRGRTLPYGALWATVDWPSESGLDEQALEQRYVRAGIMVGLMPTGQRPDGQRLGTFFWSLKAAQLETWKSSGLDPWKRQASSVWPEMAPILDQLRDAEQLSFAQYVHRTLPTPVSERLFHLGDSWHSTSPQLGQGANMALLDAYALQRALDEEADLAAALDRASRLRRRHIRLYQALSLALTPFYQSDSVVLPAIRDLLVPHVARLWPATWLQAAMVSGIVGNPLAGLGLDALRSPMVRGETKIG